MKDITIHSLRRYTDFPALIHLLKNRQLTLLDPSYWDDTNDSHYLNQYKLKKSLNCVLALCMTEASETYHHWRMFSGGASGVCIEFNAPRLLDRLLAHKGVTVKKVAYRKIDDGRLRKTGVTVDELPFLKRVGFSSEMEVRAIYESRTESRKTLAVPIDLGVIHQVLLSPWLHDNLKAGCKDVIRNIEGCARIRVYRSTLTSNDKWKRLGDAAQ
jgi:hypothetical protein